ncbi:MAG TPA: zinc ribbon domain-containing protein [Terriglobales bacterium]|nr:zinc ribbon domain-containing protein [Terriglobales bacterium]
MPQCSQCGAAVDPASKFCSECGLRLAAPEAALTSRPEEPAGPGWRRGTRVVITFLAVIAALAVIFVVFVVYFIRHTTIVTNSPNGSRVEAPFGVFTQSNDPAKLAKSLGLDLYPGARGEKSAQAELAGATLVLMDFRTNASPRQVIEFYHQRYPDAAAQTKGTHLSLVQVSGNETMTIKAALAKDSATASHTEIEISDIRR